MNYLNAIRYNRKSLIKYKWSPFWFGGKQLDKRLIDLIVSFQKENHLTADGLVGPSTYRRILTFAESQDVTYKTKRTNRKKNNFLIYNNREYEIFWPKVKLYTKKGNPKIKGKNYYSYQGKADRGPIQFVNHWDAALSTASCIKIINKRKLSMHFGIDNDGTIYQTMDMQDAAWQAGNELSNRIGLGVEISNAFYLKYQEWYVKRGFGPRPIIDKLNIHGDKYVPKHLGFYDVQLEALAALWECVSYATGMPLQVCNEKGVCNNCKRGEFSGFINHFNLTTNKIDCISLDMDRVLNKALKIRELRNEMIS